jgi:hypothetical protein
MEGIDVLDVAGLLGWLVDKSLVAVEPAGRDGDLCAPSIGGAKRFDRPSIMCAATSPNSPSCQARINPVDLGDQGLPGSPGGALSGPRP